MTEPDIKQKLGQVRRARRGRQERACGIEPCVGTNLTCPPPPHLQSYLLTHALSSIPTPPLCSPLFSLHCIYHPLPTLQTPCRNKSSACVLFVKSDTQECAAFAALRTEDGLKWSGVWRRTQTVKSDCGGNRSQCV